MKQKSHHHHHSTSINANEDKAHRPEIYSSRTDDESTKLISVNYEGNEEFKSNGCCTSTYQHIVTVQKDQFNSLSNCIKCKRFNPDSDPPPPLKERLVVILRAIFNRSVLSSIAVFTIVGSAGLMIFEASETIRFFVVDLNVFIAGFHFVNNFQQTTWRI